MASADGSLKFCEDAPSAAGGAEPAGVGVSGTFWVLDDAAATGADGVETGAVWRAGVEGTAFFGVDAEEPVASVVAGVAFGWYEVRNLSVYLWRGRTNL